MNSRGRENLRRGQEDDLAMREEMRHGAPLASGGARSVVVNRTHRVVREQAMHMEAQRQRSRGLWAPLAIVSLLMMVTCYATWGMMDGYDLTPNGIPDASDQLMILLLWSLPVTAVVLGMVWLKRGRGRMNNNGEAQP
jgi:hypothetical protein